jgi:hypothetical protein
VLSSPEKEHQHLHTNANRLHVHYKIPLHTAHDIIKSCPICAPLHCRSHLSGFLTRPDTNSHTQSHTAGSDNVLYYIYKFVYVEPSLHPWDEADLVSNLSDVLLDSVCHYFIEDFCIDIH